MTSLFSNIFMLISEPPGNLVYHLVISFAILSSLQSAYIWRDKFTPHQKKRLLIGLGVLLALRLILFLISGFAWQGLVDSQLLLPPLNRIINFISLLTIIWLWAFPDESRQADIALLLTIPLTIMFGILTYSLWSGAYTEVNFNNTILNLGWTIIYLSITIVGCVITYIRKPASWGYGLSLLVILLLGSLIHLLSALEGNFAGAIRISQIAAYPLLSILPHRLLSRKYEEDSEAVPIDSFVETTVDQYLDPNGDTRPVRVKEEQNTIMAYFNLAAESNPEHICDHLTKALSQSMVADLCLLISAPNETGQMVLLCGYDLIREESMGGASISEEDLPRLASAAQKVKPIRLPSKSKSPDMRTIADVLNLPNIGALMAVPVSLKDSTLIAFIVFLSPYSNHNWTKIDEANLMKITPQVALILTKGSSQQDNPELDLSSLPDGQELMQQKQNLVDEIESLRQTLSEQQSTMDGMEAVIASSNGSDQILSSLQEENNRLQSALMDLQSAPSNPSTQDQNDGNFREELNQAEVQIAALQKALQSSQAPADDYEVVQLRAELTVAEEQITSLQNALKNPEEQDPEDILQSAPISGQALSTEQAEVIASIAQDVRQPLSSISGYTDLLLGESVGILGALQRKFLDRVKTSTEKMNNLIDDLIQITALDSGNIELVAETVSLSNAIDSAIRRTSGQIREKNIVLRVDLPEELPHIKTDKDALHQILLHLIQNASESTPEEGEINLRAHLETDPETNIEFVVVQVTDSGTGIMEEDIPRVFSRIYRADNPLIEGVGDTGVGLSITKTLTEALGGRIWVDSEMNIGSTFNVMLPVSADNLNLNDKS